MKIPFDRYKFATTDLTAPMTSAVSLVDKCGPIGRLRSVAAKYSAIGNLVCSIDNLEYAPER